MHESDLVLRQVVLPTQHGKLQSNWEGSYHIFQKILYGAYKLEELDGRLVPMTWISTHLRYYYS